MSSIRKSVLVNGQAHFIEVNSSLELEEVEVTGADPVSGKVVQVSLSPMLKASQRQDNPSPFSIPPSAPAPVWQGLGEQTQTPSSPAPMDMFSEPALASQINPPLTYNAVPAAPNGLFNQQAGQEAPSPYSTPSQQQAGLFGQTQLAEQPSIFTPQPSQGLEAVKRKSEKEDVDDTLDGMYRY